MNKNSIVFGIALLMSLLPLSSAFSQYQGATQTVTLSVDAKALLAVFKMDGTPGGAIALNLSGATEAGAAISSNATDITTRLRITNQVESPTGRKIQAAINKDTTGTGTRLILQLTPQGPFMPNIAAAGATFPTVNLWTASQDIATGILTCWSGTGSSDGYRMNYTYEKTGATATSLQDVIVTFTISD